MSEPEDQRGTDRSAAPIRRPERCRRRRFIVPSTYEELEALVERWMAGCVQSRTIVSDRGTGRPARRERELVRGNASLLRVWNRVSHLNGQEIILGVQYIQRDANTGHHRRTDELVFTTNIIQDDNGKEDKPEPIRLTSHSDLLEEILGIVESAFHDWIYVPADSHDIEPSSRISLYLANLVEQSQSSDRNVFVCFEQSASSGKKRLARRAKRDFIRIKQIAQDANIRYYIERTIRDNSRRWYQRYGNTQSDREFREWRGRILRGAAGHCSQSQAIVREPHFQELPPGPPLLRDIGEGR